MIELLLALAGAAALAFALFGGFVAVQHLLWKARQRRLARRIRSDYRQKVPDRL